MKTRMLHFPIRGQIIALAGRGDKLSLLTRHPEALTTPLYTLNLAKGELSEQTLPVAMLALAQAGEQLYSLGQDQQLYSLNAGQATALCPVGPNALTLQAEASELFVLSSSQLQILTPTGQLLSELKLEQATALALSPDSRWLAIGFADGSIQAFNREDQPEFRAGERVSVHQTAVQQLLFDAHELQVISSASDKRLMMTQLRGIPEVGERSSKGHDGTISAMCRAPGGGFYSIGSDGSLKHWAGGFSHRQAHTTKNTHPLTALCIWGEPEHYRVATANDKGNLLVMPLDEKYRPTEPSEQIYGLTAWLNRELSSSDTRVRAAALEQVATFGDLQAAQTLADQALSDPEARLRSLSAERLETNPHASVDEQLQRLLTSADREVYLRAFRQLLSRGKLNALDVIRAALATGHKDLGQGALDELEARAPQDRHALDELINSLAAKSSELRLAAYAALSRHYNTDPIQAVLLGLSASHTDLRVEALRDGFRRELLNSREFLRLVRRHLNDSALEVRHTAYLLTILTRPALAELLRALDEDLQRRLSDLDGQKAQTLNAAEAKSCFAQLAESERAPLVEAMATPALDVCLAGAKALALIQDPRAFGVLLQLSRETNPNTRIAVSKAFSDLGDANAIPRLRLLLQDSQINVADAAFSALGQLYGPQSPLLIEAGLNAPDTKIRLRTLAVLARLLKKHHDASTEAFLEKALNDSEDAVRREAFKTLLNAQLTTERIDTLRFALRSAHTSIRYEVLLELEANKKLPWTQVLMAEMLDDPDIHLRSQSFELLQQQQRDSHEVYRKALNSRFPDLRQKVLELLFALKTKSTNIFDLIESRLEDREPELRQKALAGLIELSGQDPESAQRLQRALNNPELDVRVAAAAAQAASGDPAALEPLLAVLNLPEPPEHDKKNHQAWTLALNTAISGLGQLADPIALSALRKLILTPKSPFAKEAAKALRNVARVPEDVADLLSRGAQEVRSSLALALAALGDDRALADVLVNKSNASLAAVCQLRKVSPEPLYGFLDQNNQSLRQRALKLCLLLDLGERNSSPAACLAGLAAAHLDIRLQAASALEHYGDPAEFLRVVTEIFNQRSSHEADWELPNSLIQSLAAGIALAPHPIALILTEGLLTQLDQPEQIVFERWWQRISSRFGTALSELLNLCLARPPVKSEALMPLAVGTYVGILRLNDAAARAIDRQTALKRLADLALRVPDQAEAIVTCLKIALYDSAYFVRDEAFERLKPMMPAQELAAEGLATEHRDLARKSLELLMNTPDQAYRDSLLSELQLTATNGTEIEAHGVLLRLLGEVQANTSALNARSVSLRYQAVRALNNLYPKAPAAGDALFKALNSGFADVRHGAAKALAEHKDLRALPALLQMLNSPDLAVAELSLECFEQLNHPAAAADLIQFVESKPHHALSEDIIELMSDIGDESAGRRLIGLLDLPAHKQHQRTICITVRDLSAYDQPLELLNGQPVVIQSMLWGQAPRALHHSLFAELLQRLTELGLSQELMLITALSSHCPEPGVDTSLELLSRFKDAPLREAALYAVGLRLRELDQQGEALRTQRIGILRAALNHPEADSKFLAAEGLALAGHPDGIQVLLTSIDLLAALVYRQRAVLALGQLAHPRAFDQLLLLAKHEGHALQEQAVEAIGHLKSGPHAEVIFNRLKQIVKADAPGLKLHALTGLRWFNSPEAWGLIREQVTSPDWQIPIHAIGLLKHDVDPDAAVKVLRLRLKTESQYYLVQALGQTLKTLLLDQPLEAEYLFLFSPNQNALETVLPGYLRRISRKGEPERLLNMLEEISDLQVREQLISSLLGRSSEVTLTAALKALPKAGLLALDVILQLLGRDRQALPADQLETLTDHYLQRWHNQRKDTVIEADTTRALLQRLAWFAGRLGQMPKAFADLLSKPEGLSADDRLALSQAVLEALPGKLALSEPWQALLQSWSSQGDSRLRALATDLLATQASLAAVLDTPSALQRLSAAALWQDPVMLTMALRKGTALQQLGPDAIPALTALLKAESDEQTIAATLEVLGHLGQEAAEAAINDFLSRQLSSNPDATTKKKSAKNSKKAQAPDDDAEAARLRLTRLAERLLRHSQRQHQRDLSRETSNLWQEALA